MSLDFEESQWCHWTKKNRIWKKTKAIDLNCCCCNNSKQRNEKLQGLYILTYWVTMLIIIENPFSIYSKSNLLKYKIYIYS